MDSKTVIFKSRQYGFNSFDKEILKKLEFFPIEERQQIDAEDKNREFRQLIIEDLYEDYSIIDIELIRFLAKEEIKATIHDLEHLGLALLCFYLFTLAQIEDVFIIYEAKYMTRCMDASFAIEREMLKMQHTKEEMLNYIDMRLKNDPEMQKKYCDLKEELIDVYNNPDYESDRKYLEYILGYYYGEDNIEEVDGEIKIIDRTIKNN